MHTVHQQPISKFPSKLLVYQRRPKTSIQPGSVSKEQIDICILQRSSSSLPQISDSQEVVQASFSPVQDSSANKSATISCQDYFPIQDNSANRSATVSCQRVFPLSIGFCNQEHLLTSSQTKFSSSFVSQEIHVPMESSSSIILQNLADNTSVSLQEQGQFESYSSLSLSESHKPHNHISDESLEFGTRKSFHPMLTRSKTGSLKAKVCLSAITTCEVSQPKIVKQAFERKE
ncbi:hypothetical protein V6N11_048006 [Hibiscus sabdariffa]|uniref:Uncharacterized protein n=1 Tax=Hibiscus sabdariffa TaxID=183260 RepID=A0ABR2NXH4_9ROSI